MKKIVYLSNQRNQSTITGVKSWVVEGGGKENKETSSRESLDEPVDIKYIQLQCKGLKTKKKSALSKLSTAFNLFLQDLPPSHVEQSESPLICSIVRKKKKKKAAKGRSVGRVVKTVWKKSMVVDNLLQILENGKGVDFNLPPFL